MTKSNVVGFWFLLVVGLFLGVVIYGFVRGRPLTAAFLPLAVMFFILWLAQRRKRGGPPGPEATD